MKNPQTGEDLAILLQMLEHADGDTMLSAKLRADSRGPVTIEWHWQTATAPTWALCLHDEWTLLLVAGCASYDQAARVAFGYLSPRSWLALPGDYKHDYYTELGTLIYTSMAGRPRLMNQPVMLAGHSLGGCVAQSVAWLLKHQHQITSNCQISTFGSPKWGWRWQQVQIASIPQARWMNSDDPVPLVYPTINDYLPFLIQYTAVQALGVTRFTQAAGGLVIEPTGHIEGGDYPPLTAVEWQISMAGWIWGFESAPAANPHSLAQYRARLHTFNELHVQPRSLPRGAEGIAPIEEHNRRLVNRAEAVVERRLAAAEAAQREVHMRVPPERLVHVERRGRVHVLLWNEQVITVVVRRRSALSLARDCNRFLHHLLNAGLVQPDTVVEQLRQFLGAATDPTSGITPTINTKLPTEIV